MKDIVKRILYNPTSIFIAILLILSSFIILASHTFSFVTLPTYFTYTDAEMKILSNQSSDYVVSKDSLKKWDLLMFSLIRKNLIADIYASRIFAYLYTAQRDATFLSYNVQHDFMGSLDPISAKVLCLFFSSECSHIIKNSNMDKYSNVLADIVIEKIKARIKLDNEHTKIYTEKYNSRRYWAGVHPYLAQDAGSWKTWLIKSANEFLIPAPPAYNAPEWNTQLNLAKSALSHVTLKQVKLIVYWAGNPGTVTPPGLWLMFTNDYMWSHCTSLPNSLLIRSILAMTMADAEIATFHSKYTYWTKRPFMLDPSMQTIMPTPNHPSYPANHSSVSGAASIILIHYFPENTQDWLEKENEASQSRVWAGVGFNIDIEQGIILGEKIGKAALHEQAENNHE